MRETAFVFAACVAAVALAAGPSPDAPLVTVDATRSTAVITESHVAAGASVTVDLRPTAPQLRAFFEYDDPRYARGRGMSDRFANGFPAHLEAALAYRGLDATVTRVDADALRRVLGEDAAGVCVIVPGGILPATVRSAREDLLRSFLSRGGAVVWAGAPFDLFYSSQGRDSAAPIVSSPDATWWPRLYAGRGPLDARDDVDSPPLRFGTAEASLDRATGLMFDATTFAVDARRLSAIGGAPLAFIDASGDSSVSQLPLGPGRLVIFGDAFPDEMDAAREIAQVVATGAWYAPRDIRVAARLGSTSPRASVAVPPGSRVFAFGDPPFYFPFGY